MGVRWSSTNRNGDVETFTDLEGRPTTSRPHVHTMFHDGGASRVTIIATSARGEHPFRRELRDADGNAVLMAQRELAHRLDERERASRQPTRDRRR